MIKISKENDTRTDSIDNNEINMVERYRKMREAREEETRERKKREQSLTESSEIGTGIINSSEYYDLKQEFAVMKAQMAELESEKKNLLGMKQEINELLKSLKIADESLEDYSNKNITLKQQIEQISLERSDLIEKNKELEKKLNEFNTIKAQCIEINDLLNKNQNELDIRKEQNKKLRNEIGILKEKTVDSDSINHEISRLNAENVKLIDEIEAYKEEINNLKKNLGSIGLIAVERDKLQKYNQELLTEINNLKETQKQNIQNSESNEIPELNNKISKLNIEIATLKKNLRESQSKLSQNQTEAVSKAVNSGPLADLVADLRKKIEKQQQIIKKLQTPNQPDVILIKSEENDLVNSEILEIKKENEILRDENQELKDLLDEQKKNPSNLQLQSLIEDLQKKNEKLKREIMKLRV